MSPALCASLKCIRSGYYKVTDLQEKEIASPFAGEDSADPKSACGNKSEAPCV